MTNDITTENNLIDVNNNDRIAIGLIIHIFVECNYNNN
jgi:hypothetical protein